MITCHKIQCLAILWHCITLTPSCDKPNNKSLFTEKPEKYVVISVKFLCPLLNSWWIWTVELKLLSPRLKQLIFIGSKLLLQVKKTNTMTWKIFKKFPDFQFPRSIVKQLTILGLQGSEPKNILKLFLINSNKGCFLQ